MLALTVSVAFVVTSITQSTWDYPAVTSLESPDQDLLIVPYIIATFFLAGLQFQLDSKSSGGKVFLQNGNEGSFPFCVQGTEMLPHQNVLENLEMH